MSTTDNDLLSRSTQMATQTTTTNATLKQGAYILHEGSSWKVLGVGATNEESGKTYVHLASEIEAVKQKNGQRPKQIAIWVSA